MRPSAFILISIVCLLASLGFFPESSAKSPKYDRLPPLQSDKNGEEFKIEPGKKKKFKRRIYRLGKNEYDIKISYPNKKKSMFSGGRSPQVGFALHCADINGDGMQDLIIGAPFPEGPVKSRDNLEKVFLIFGRKKFPRVIDLRKADLVLYRPYSAHSARFGQAIATGDLNGDGLQDLILGAPHSTGREGVFRSGEVYIVYGRKKMSGRKNIEKVADTIITGTEISGEAGFAVASGDLNGDGLEDIIIGAPGANRDNKVMAGRTFVIFGRKRIPRRLSLSISWDMRLTGIDGPNAYMAGFLDPPDRSGSALATGDINNDGFEDLLIAAPFANGPDNNRPGAGEVYAVFGKKEMKRNIDLATEADLTLWGAIKGTFAGYSLSSGDISGDGIDDIILGAGDSRFSKKRKWRIAAYALYGKESLPYNVDLIRDADLVWKDKMTQDTPSLFSGKEKVDYYRGYSTALGDFIGDSAKDLLLGRPGPSGRRGIIAYIASGNQRSRIKNLAEEFDGLILQRRRKPRGNHAVAVGDINGDGRSDLVVRDAGTANESGIVYVILGRN